MLRVAVLGGGFMGGQHARAYAKLPNVKVAGIASRGSERARALAAELGAAHVPDPYRLVEDPDVDAVDVCLPSDRHEEMAVAALRAGKHVLVEKPLALSLDSADRIIAAWRASGRKLMVGQVLRFWPEYVALQRIATSGRLGAAARRERLPALDRPGLLR